MKCYLLNMTPSKNIVLNKARAYKYMLVYGEMSLLQKREAIRVLTEAVQYATIEERMELQDTLIVLGPS